MKILNRLFIILITLTYCQYPLFASENQADSLKFIGKLSENATNVKMHIGYNKRENFDPSKTIGFSINIINNGTVNFSLPNLKKTFKLFMSLSTSKGILFDKNYFVEPNDNITFKLDFWPNTNFLKGRIYFYGNGSEKYNLIEELQRQYFDDFLHEAPYSALMSSNVKLNDTADLNAKMDELASLLNLYNRKKISQIKEVSISDSIKSIIGYEYASYSSVWYGVAKSLYYKYPQFRNQITQKYFSYRGQFFETPSSLSLYKCF
jgi:hypothetical protein